MLIATVRPYCSSPLFPEIREQSLFMKICEACLSRPATPAEAKQLFVFAMDALRRMFLTGSIPIYENFTVN